MMIAARASFGCVSHCGGWTPHAVVVGLSPCQRRSTLIGPYSGLKSQSQTSPYAMSGITVGSAAEER